MENIDITDVLFLSTSKPELKEAVTFPEPWSLFSAELGQDSYFLAHRTVHFPSNSGKYEHPPFPDYVQYKDGLLKPY